MTLRFQVWLNFPLVVATSATTLLHVRMETRLSYVQIERCTDCLALVPLSFPPPPQLCYVMNAKSLEPTQN